MPSGYTHHRFGEEIIPLLPKDVQHAVSQNRALFDLGLHGPDFFFFHHYFKQTEIFYLGSAYHKKSGQVFFQDACARAKALGSDAATAYLYGLLAHYGLDSGAHPFVYQMTDGTGLGHSELETEFDRYLMVLDGIKKPHEYNVFRKLRLQKYAYDTVSRFYPELTPKDTTRCIRGMIFSRYLLTIPTTLGHRAVEWFVTMAEGNTGGQHMTIGPNTRCSHLDEALMALYRQSVERFPVLLEQLNRHLAYGEPLGDDFKANFNQG